MKKKKIIDHDAKISEFVGEINDIREIIARLGPSAKTGGLKRRISTLKFKIRKEHALKNNLSWVPCKDVVGIWSSTVAEDVAKESKESDDDSL